MRACCSQECTSGRKNVPENEWYDNDNCAGSMQRLLMNCSAIGMRRKRQILSNTALAASPCWGQISAAVVSNALGLGLACASKVTVCAQFKTNVNQSNMLAKAQKLLTKCACRNHVPDRLNSKTLFQVEALTDRILVCQMLNTRCLTLFLCYRCSSAAKTDTSMHAPKSTFTVTWPDTCRPHSRTHMARSSSQVKGRPQTTKNLTVQAQVGAATKNLCVRSGRSFPRMLY